MIEGTSLGPYLDQVLADATIPELPNHYRGKVRDNYDLSDGRRIIIATDRLSAFDQVIAAIPLKGQVLTQIARFWFDATGDVCPNHVIEYPDPNVLVCRRLAIMPVEIVVRDYLTGTTATSIWPMYQSGRREIYGIRFPDGLHENQELPETIITPTTKAIDGGHDEPLTAGEIVARKLLTQQQWEMVSELALALFARGREIAGEHGLILVEHQIRIRFPPGRPHRACRRDSHTRQQPLLARRQLPATPRRGRIARKSRQGFCPALGDGPLRPLSRPDPADPP